ncbi:MAG TPA: cob(I)yrinic acid a,c-diamide adenosyltransferase [Gammaproteobacteria bacterium]|nr:cob(I)yrinic acid a,c-diamide adenosyltransferase [Gammaproteobacteria bacterium]
MGNRLSKIYTRTGDDGSTGLGDGSRVPKDDAHVEAYGTLDELNSALGLLLAEPLSDDLRATLAPIQHELFDLGSEFCLPGYTAISADHVQRLETTLDRFNANLPPLKEFILPGGGRAAALCHLARTVCRRAERRAWSLHRQHPQNPESIKYLNRLSDLLFVLARVIVRQDGGLEVLWKHERKKTDPPH